MKRIFFASSLMLLLAGCSTEPGEVPTEGTPMESGETSGENLQTYQSSEYGFEFQFPEEWTLNSTSSENEIVSVYLPESAQAGTNVSSASFTVAVQPEESLEACLSEEVEAAMASPFSADQFEVVNGVTYYVSAGGEGTAGPDYNAKFKRTYRAGQCFEMVEGMWSSNIGFYGEDTNTIDAVDEVWRSLDAIFQSFNMGSPLK